MTRTGVYVIARRTCRMNRFLRRRRTVLHAFGARRFFTILRREGHLPQAVTKLLLRRSATTITIVSRFQCIAIPNGNACALCARRMIAWLRLCVVLSQSRMGMALQRSGFFLGVSTTPLHSRAHLGMLPSYLLFQATFYIQSTVYVCVQDDALLGRYSPRRIRLPENVHFC